MPRPSNTVNTDIDSTTMNVASQLTRQAGATPQALALLHGERSFSYAQLDALVWGLCRHLHGSGLRRGDVVGLHLLDPLLHLAAVLALARSGMVSVAVSAVGGEAVAGRDILRRTAASAVIDGDHRLDWGLPTHIELGLEQVAAFAAAPDATLLSEAPDQLLHYKTSSGTTGAPKIVGATHAGMMASIAREIECIGYPPGERYLTPVAMSHDGPRRRYLACLAAGATAVMPPDGTSAAALIETIERHDVRHFSCVPSQAYELAAAVAPGRQRFPQMRCLRLSAGPSEASLHRLLRERLSPNVLISYGCTELGPMAVAPPELVASQPQTVGRAMPGVELQVVSADDQLLPAHAVGTIRIRAEGMPQAYHDDAQATARFFKGGWFYPGDLGKTDDEGLLFHMGRADGMMIMNGVNIYPAEIEQAMLSHAAVRDAVAMPLPHRIAHQVPVCAVALNDGERPSEQALQRFARGLLGSHAPRRVVILPNIARNSLGKVQRQALQQAIVSRLEADRVQRRRQALVAAAPVAAAWRQLQLFATLGFVLPAPLNLRQLDTWLHGVLQLELPPVPGEMHPSAHDVGDIEPWARAWLQRLLLVTRLLLQAARIPVFDAPQVLGCSADPARGNSWRARVSFARVDELPPAAYELAFTGAEQLNAWAMTHHVAADTLQSFYALMQQHVAAGLAHTMPMGHSRMPVLRVAHGLRIPFTHLGAGVFQLGWGQRARRVDGSVSDQDSALGARLCGSKAVAAAVMRRAGLPAPRHELVTTWPQALAAARRIGWPIVVKPVDRDRGEGVVIDIGDEHSLKAAFDAAHALSRKQAVLVEQQVQGVCHRLFMAQRRLLYAVKRGPMSVTGDGVTALEALVDAEVARQGQRPPWERSGIAPLDDLARGAMAHAGFTPVSVPDKGVRVPLRRIESTQWGGVDEEVTLQIHPENLRVATLAAALFGLDMAGIDLITPDITRPWYENGAVINEVNFRPLLGGAAISRSHLPAFLNHLVEGRGTLPVEVFVGGAPAWAAATQRWLALRAQGVAAYLSHGHETLQPSGQPWPMPIAGLYPRTRALVLCAQVQALVLVVQTDEFLSSGLPLEAIGTLTLVDEQLVSAQSPHDQLTPERAAATWQLLRRWPRLEST